MPRRPRQDYPGAQHHVMARGIERRVIFNDDLDRRRFLDRLARVLPETGTRCLAFALMPNHYHLFLETGATPLWKVLHRLGTGHGIVFNRRHERVGHLFQNRYKSRLVEEEGDPVGLVRYIHLNPVRAGLVPDVDALAGYAWTGHATLMGRRRAPFLDVPAVLALFGSDPREAREELVRCMRAGAGARGSEVPAGGGPGDAVDEGDEDEELARLLPVRPDRDDAIEGRGALDRERRRLASAGWDLDRVIRVVCGATPVPSALVRSGRRTGPASRAREAIVFLAGHRLGIPHARIARATGVSPAAVSQALTRFLERPGSARESVERLLEGGGGAGGGGVT